MASSYFAKNQLSLVGTIWSVLSLVATVLIGLLIFGEKLNIMGITGIIFAFMAIVFLSLA
jgi:multidrug transporter EmrE-like cation transporter